MQCDVDKSRAVAEYWVQHLDEEGDEIPFHQDKDEALWKREETLLFLLLQQSRIYPMASNRLLYRGAMK